MYKSKPFLKIRFSFLFFAVFFSLLTGNFTRSQVVVEKSKDKVIISGKPYYIHIVKKGETAYSISKAYGITLEELVRNNPSASAVLKEGQALRIPVSETLPEDIRKPTVTVEQKRDESKYYYHKLRPGDTVYSLAKSFGVTVDDIIKSNLGVDINKLPVNSEIVIPRKELITTPKSFEVSEKEYITHKVMKGESMSSIAEKYGITVRDLRRENKGVIFPHVDDLLKIPVFRVIEPARAENIVTDTIKTEPDKVEDEMPSEITPVKNLKGEFNVAVLLPFYIKDNSIRTEIDSSQIVKGKPVYKTVTRPEHWLYPPSIPFIELYQGILLAADTLRSMGLDINIYAFDTGSDSVKVSNLIRSGSLKKMDLIIGPVYTNQLLQVAEYSKEEKIPVVSPVPLKSNQPLKENPYLFMSVPSVQVSQQLISKRALLFRNSNFVFIHGDNSFSDTSVINFRNLLLQQLRSGDEYDHIKFKELLFISRSSLPADSINRLEQALSPRDDNVVIIASEDYPVLSETIMDLHTLSKRYNIRLIGYPAVRELFNLDPKLYFDLGIELYTNYWIDYSQADVRSFLMSYRKKFLTEPEEGTYAWSGYDIMYYFLSGLALHGGKFINRPSIHNPDLLQTRFLFRRENRNDGFENKYLYLVKYTSSMDLVLIDDNLQKP